MSKNNRKPGRLLRWFSVLLRAIHLATAIGLGAAILGAELDVQRQAIGVLISGVAMLALDLRCKPQMVWEWTGASMLLKLVLIGWLALDAGLREPLFWVIVIWSVVFAHAPREFRHGRWWPATNQGD